MQMSDQDMFIQPVSKPILAFAPMKDISHPGLWDLLNSTGAPDIFCVPFYRVHESSRITSDIKQFLFWNHGESQLSVQIAGHHVESIIRAARELQQFPVSIIDFNIGCPVPIVCRKGAGGAILRNLNKLELILLKLRENIACNFSVKTRLGWDSTEEFPQILKIINNAHADLVTVHGRTVKQMYSGSVDLNAIELAAKTLNCKVLANGDIVNPDQAIQILRKTSVSGLMIGRAAVANPFIFNQIRQRLNLKPPQQNPDFRLSEYVYQLYKLVTTGISQEISRIEKFKKYIKIIISTYPFSRFKDNSFLKITSETQLLKEIKTLDLLTDQTLNTQDFKIC